MTDVPPAAGSRAISLLTGLGVGVTGTGGLAWLISELKPGSSGGASDLAKSPSTVTTFAGLAGFLYAARSPLEHKFAQNMLLGGTVAMIAIGAGGMVSSIIPTYWNSNEPLGTLGTNGPKDAGTGAQIVPRSVPHSVSELGGLDVAKATVLNKDGSLADVQVYVDPSSAHKLSATSVKDAMGEARAYVQRDATYRAEAVVQTADKTYWAVQLSGALDQVDGQHYGDDNSYQTGDEADDHPAITPNDPGLKAIVGLDSNYDFSSTQGATSATGGSQ